jgi:hypothetical protein
LFSERKWGVISTTAAKVMEKNTNWKERKRILGVRDERNELVELEF